MVLEKSDIYKATRKFYFVYKLLGLTPYSLISQKATFLATKLDLVYTTTVMLIIFISSYFGMVDCIQHCRDAGVTAVFYILRSYVGVLVKGLIWLSAQIYAKRLASLFGKFTEVDKKILVLTGGKHLYLAKPTWTYWIVGFRYVLSIGGLLLEAGSEVYSGSTIPPICTISSCITTIMMAHSASMYIVLIGECHRRLNLLSNYIEMLLLTNKKIQCVETITTPKTNIPYELEKLKQIYLELVCLTSEINRIFQVQLLTKMTVTFINVVGSVYYVLDYSIEVVSLTRKIITLSSQLFWGLSYLVDLMLDIYVYDRLVTEVSNMFFNLEYSKIKHT